jgi:hypothetical protein
MTGMNRSFLLQLSAVCISSKTGAPSGSIRDPGGARRRDTYNCDSNKRAASSPRAALFSSSSLPPAA